MTYEEKCPADESDIRELVERVRKRPIKKRPDILDAQDWDVCVLFAKSYNRHNNNRDRIKIKEDFYDKRFAEILGDNSLVSTKKLT